MKTTAALNSRGLATRLLPLLDLTRLGEDDSPEQIEALCDAACTDFGSVAAVCVYPEHVTSARRKLGVTLVRIATVVNFPDGGDDIERVVRETRRALAAGADEIDLVLPYRALLRGQTALCADLVGAARRVCGSERILKLILETGVLGEAGKIREACAIGLQAGVDFLKTSTGKVPLNATPEAARVVLEAIRADGGRCGFKASGGIRSLEDAAAYLRLVDQILGPDWVSPAHLRFGASALLDVILAALADSP